jgi:exodeoxyribonuclease-3
MRIITWNVNSVGMRKDRLVRLLDRWSPDVLCLQELKCVEEKFPWETVQEAGYHASVFGQKTYNGVALISKETPKTVIRSFGDAEDDAAARFIVGEFPGNLHVASLYVPNGQAVGSDKYTYKLRWLSRLKAYLNQHHAARDRLVLAGDYNIAPTDADVYDPKAWEGEVLCSVAERRALREVEDLGYHDAYRLLHPQDKAFTWWDYRMLAFPKNLGLRIDLLLVSEALKGAVKGCQVDRDERKGDKPSDHAPVILDLEVS